MLGKKIQQLRKDNGMSQEELASKLTISRQAISKWELGESMPDTENIVQLSKLFGVSTGFLLNDDFRDEVTKTVDNQSDDLIINDTDKKDALSSSRQSCFKRFITKPVVWIIIPILIIIVTVAVLFFTRMNYVEIYNDPTISEENDVFSYDAGRIFILLSEIDVSYRVDGNRILVPENRVDEVNAYLKYHGIIAYPGSDHAELLYERQLAEDIRAAITQAQSIDDALVIINDGSVSVFLMLSNDEMLSESDIISIYEKIGSTVPHYTYIEISDSNLNFYTIGDENIE